MKSVVLCGSSRFKLNINSFASHLKKRGVVVFEPYLHEGEDEWQSMSKQYKNFSMLGLTLDHFQKIRMADVVFIYNQDGYVGNSTTLEIGFAVALAKPIYALEESDPELARAVLYRGYMKNADSLYEYLK